MSNEIEPSRGHLPAKSGENSAKDIPAEFDPSMIDGAILLTDISSRNPKIHIQENARRIIAIFDNGVALIATGEAASPHARAAMKSARALDIPVRRESTFSIEPESLIALYQADRNNSSKAEAAASGPIAEIADSRRQVMLREIIGDAARIKATDVHIMIGKNGFANIRPRVNNRLQRGKALEPLEAMRLINAVFAVADGVTGDSSLVIRDGALMPRSNLLPHNVEMIRLHYTPIDGGRGALSMRLKFRSDKSDNSLSSLGYNKAQLRDLQRMRRRTNGLYILAGKVSSGKSTTLQRMLNLIYEENGGEVLIYTVEDPVELDLHDAVQFTAREQIDPSNPDNVIDGFEAGIVGSLRSDMNIGVVGEIRNTKVANKAIDLVNTGHAVYTTVHAGSALRILGRLSDLHIDKYRLADPDVIAGLIYQRLVGVICPHCRITVREGLLAQKITPELAVSLCETLDMSPDELYLRGPGCGKCTKGLKGRTVAAEVIMPDEKLLSIFATTGDPIQVKNYWTGDDSPEIPPEERGMGGIPVIHHALSKVGAGLIDINEVEQEINFLDFYLKEFPHLIPRLRKDARELREEILSNS